jgi:flagellar hook-associated protein 2
MGTFGVNLNTAGLGLGTGINVAAFVQQLTQAASVPLQQMQAEQATYTAQQNAISNINSLLSTLQNATLTLQDPLGPMAAVVANSSNSSVLTASAASGTATGTHTVTVNSLATTSSFDTNTLASGTTTFGTGQFTLQVGSNTATTITVDSTNNTLNGLASAINGGNYGVTASVITDANGSRLALVSNTSGVPGNISITGNTTGLTFSQTATGTNASFTLDGVPLNSTSNTVTGVLSGVTLNLVGTSSSPVTLTLSGDPTQATNAINSFVSAYNAVVQAINTQQTYTPNATSQPPLFSDSSLAQVQQTLATDMNYVISGNNGITSLSSFGVNLQQDGTLQVDTTSLNSALTASFSSVQNFFQQVGSTNGFAVNLNNSLATLTNPASGPLYVDNNGITGAQNALASQISAFQANLAQQQQTWLQEYSQVNTTLQTLPLMLAQINGQLGALSGSTTTSSSSSTPSLP